MSALDAMKLLLGAGNGMLPISNPQLNLPLMSKKIIPNAYSGSINNDVQYVDEILRRNQNLDFVKRLFEKNTPSIQLKGQNSPSTHMMESSDNFTYPTIIRNADGKLVYLNEKDKDAAYNYAMKTKEYIKHNSPEEANWFAQNGYKLGTNVLKK